MAEMLPFSFLASPIHQHWGLSENHDDDGDENAAKQKIQYNRQNNTLARAFLRPLG